MFRRFSCITRFGTSETDQEIGEEKEEEEEACRPKGKYSTFRNLIYEARGTADLKVASSQTKIDENFANYLLKIKDKTSA